MRYVVYLIPTGNVPETVVDRACPHHLCVCVLFLQSVDAVAKPLIKFLAERNL